VDVGCIGRERTETGTNGGLLHKMLMFNQGRSFFLVALSTLPLPLYVHKRKREDMLERKREDMSYKFD
jgi:hypothetical protein